MFKDGELTAKIKQNQIKLWIHRWSDGETPKKRIFLMVCHNAKAISDCLSNLFWFRGLGSSRLWVTAESNEG